MLRGVDFFSSISEDVTYFDEGPDLYISQSVSSSNGINTSAIDAFRQGVEITLTKHYVSGTAKIYAGERGHVMRRNHYGLTQTPITSGVPFVDMQNFNVVAFVSASSIREVPFPIVVGDGEQQIGRNGILDGIIEPLTIRAKAGFFSLDVPRESHDVRGSFGCGNIDHFDAADQVLSIDYVDQNTDAKEFMDMVDMFDGRIPMNGYFSVEQVQLQPFDDVSRNASLFSEFHDDAFQSALSQMLSGSTESFVSSNKRSASAGWYYDNVSSPMGTDSIAFGGMKY